MEDLIGRFPEKFYEGIVQDYAKWCASRNRFPLFSEWITYTLDGGTCPNIFAAMRYMVDNPNWRE